MKQPLHVSLAALYLTFSLICETAVHFDRIRVAVRDVSAGEGGPRGNIKSRNESS